MKRFYQDLKLGVLGGGQLGRMLIQASIDLNIYSKVMDPSAEAPCSAFAPSFVQGAITDYDTVLAFGKDLDVITIEIENVNVEALKQLQIDGKIVHPDPYIIELIQDKRTQKQFFQEKGLPSSPFVLVDNKEAVKKHRDRLPFVQKLGKAGYDGRGVQIIRSEEELEKAFDEPGLIEDLIPFEKELAVLVARNANDDIITYPIVEMVFHPEQNLVEYLFSPAEISAHLAEEARQLAHTVVKELKYVGIMAIEMFLTPDNQLLINELAPRPHNSGHHTIRACSASQYEQHLRAILGLPLGDPVQLCPAAMVNMLGNPNEIGPAIYAGIEHTLAIPGAYPHIYGKTQTKPFRKMGHVTLLGEDLMVLKNKVGQVQELLQVISDTAPS
ncbi:MAG: 5-(carboxyamino)imidazole ribonucleotide synthase [Bacteroidota bacterium]